MCHGATSALSDTTVGGIWSSSDTFIAAIDVAGVVSTPYAASGTVTITYTVGTSYVTTSFTVNPLPYIASISPTICGVGTTISLSASPVGGNWSTSVPAVATVDLSGHVTSLAGGNTTISYILPTGCSDQISIFVDSSPVITITHSGICSLNDTLLAHGGSGVFMWTRASGISSGLSCLVCNPVIVHTFVTDTLIAHETSSFGCADSGIIVINGDRISGRIFYTSPAPTNTESKVWLIHYNPTDSSIAAVDSITTCSTGAGYADYLFYNELPGNYLAKAKLIYGSAPGTSGFIPTYGLSTPYWDSAETIIHTAGATDGLTTSITMRYGIVPAGPGFVSGYVYTGAGKNTTMEVPASNMLVYLKDAAGQVLTYTYTDALGAYTFSGLANGTYYIYPQEFSYYTTQSAPVVLSSSSMSATAVNFKQHTTSGTITPYAWAASVNNTVNSDHFEISPNPSNSYLNVEWHNLAVGAGTLTLTDITGRVFLTRTININDKNGTLKLDLEGQREGIYYINITSAATNFNEKLVIVR